MGGYRIESREGGQTIFFSQQTKKIKKTWKKCTSFGFFEFYVIFITKTNFLLKKKQIPLFYQKTNLCYTQTPYN